MGVVFLVRLSLYWQFGGFDGDYFVYFEEIDLCWCIKCVGYKIMAWLCFVVYYVGGGIFFYNIFCKVFLNFCNSLFILVKNEIGSWLAWILLVCFFFDGVAGLLFLFQGKFQYIVFIVQAYWFFFGQWQAIWCKWWENQDWVVKVSIVSKFNFCGCYFKSIVWAFYVCNIQYFKDF